MPLLPKKVEKSHAECGMVLVWLGVHLSCEVRLLDRCAANEISVLQATPVLQAADRTAVHQRKAPRQGFCSPRPQLHVDHVRSWSETESLTF